MDAVLSWGVRRVLFFNGHTTGAEDIKAEGSAPRRRIRRPSAAMAVRPDCVHPEDCFASEVVHFSDALRNVHIHNVLRGRYGEGDPQRQGTRSRRATRLRRQSEPRQPGDGQAIVDAVVDYTVRFVKEFENRPQRGPQGGREPPRAVLSIIAACPVAGRNTPRGGC